MTTTAMDSRPHNDSSHRIRRPSDAAYTLRPQPTAQPFDHPSSINPHNPQAATFDHDRAIMNTPPDYSFFQPPTDFGTSPSNGNGHMPQHRNSIGSRPRAGSGEGMPYGSSLGAASAIHGPMPMPMSNLPGARMGNGSRPFDRPRSPPNTKNTSHVPCKFFRQGQCQAGPACPFQHSVDVAVCKYFQKGNCKFGMRCANDHITQDGRRVNRPPINPQGQSQPQMGPRMGPGMPIGPPSMLSPQYDTFSPPQPIPGAHSDEYTAFGSYKIPIMYNERGEQIGSHPGSTFGSPSADNRFAMSPMQKGLSVLDAGLPASFDSQGVSYYAKTGPFAASVPSRFGLTGLESSSPPSSFTRGLGESSVVRKLRDSAFGEDNVDKNSSVGSIGSSPPVTTSIDLARRRLHSERFTSRPNVLSSSLDTRSRTKLAAEDWDPTLGFEGEELLPDSLKDLLTPQEKMRRSSRNAEDETTLSQRMMLAGLGSGNGTPAESPSKVGSPLGASPSRYGALFSRQKSDNSIPSLNDSSNAGLSFGHVGSPLRNSYLSDHQSTGFANGSGLGSSALNNTTSINGDGFLSSPPRQASMSMISQQLQRNRLQNRAVSEEKLSNSTLGGSSRNISSSSAANGSTFTTTALPTPSSSLAIPNPASRFDRSLSSSSLGGIKIDEEQDEVFDMDDELESTSASANTSNTTAGALGDGHKRSIKRSSGGLWAIGKASPRLGPIGGQRSASGTASVLSGLGSPGSMMSSGGQQGSGSPWNT